MEKKFPLKRTFCWCILILIVANQALCKDTSETWHFKDELLPELTKAVPGILKDQSTTSGRFGSGIWMVNDQHAIYPLAAAWSIKHEKNPYYHDAAVLEAVMKGGDALIDDQDATGQWVFRKKDGSTWGNIYMPWTYSRWIRAFSLIREAMPPERRARWEKALLLGYTGIVRGEFNEGVQNIPAHHAMGLYFAGKVFGREEWCRIAAEFMGKVAGEQAPDGYWSENNGPVMGYGLVYVDALGTYYGVSRDPKVFPSLEKTAVFHSNFTYPDGSNVETVDERQIYHNGASMPGVGFSFTPEGRGYMKRQFEVLKKRKKDISAETAASLILYGEEGQLAPVPALDEARSYVTKDGKAGVFSKGKWFTCLSAYHTTVPVSRWIQDRQNLVSLFHADAGLILGGGNTKLQPLWSTFTVGDPKLLTQKPGDEDPKFTPPPGIWHVPDSAELVPNEKALVLNYDGANCRVDVNIDGPKAILHYSCTKSTSQPVEAHVPFLPAVGGQWKTASGKQGKLGETELRLSSAEIGPWFEHRGWRVSVPSGAEILWPARQHNPYTKDGSSELEAAKLVLVVPFKPEQMKVSIEVTVSEK